LVQVFINIPWWYLAVNRMISLFLTIRTKSKFVFAGPSKSTETLLRWGHKVSNFALSLLYFGLVYGFDVSVSLHFQIHSSGAASGEVRWIKQRWGVRKYRCCHRNHSEAGIKAYRGVSSYWGWFPVAFSRTGFWELIHIPIASIFTLPPTFSSFFTYPQHFSSITTVHCKNWRCSSTFLQDLNLNRTHKTHNWLDSSQKKGEDDNKIRDSTFSNAGGLNK